MAMEVKEATVTSVAHPAAQPTHSAIWQTEMNAAFAAFLQGIKERLIDSGHVNPRPIVLSYESSLPISAAPASEHVIAFHR